MRWVIVLFLSFGLYGCTTSYYLPSPEQPKPQFMVPSIDASASVATTIGVSPITDGKRSFPRWKFFGGFPLLEGEEFRQALLATLGRSGLFEGVVPGEGGALRLNTQILLQDFSGVVAMVAKLSVRYELQEGGSGNTVWVKEISSQFEVTFSDEWKGVKRTRKALEGAVRENLSELIAEMAAFFRKR